MKYIVAVSGGVDSVVLLHKLVMAGEHELIVAHFDHGIRPESDADARFVEGLAQSHGLEFQLRREVLGARASEALARERRYAFLHELTEQYDAQIVTAHHQDDVVETIAINLIRGTGWRGLAVFGSHNNIVRPLLDMTKQEIYDYALRHTLEWVEDETNQTDDYLRNRLRKKLTRLPIATRRKLLGLWQRQLALRSEIEHEEQIILAKTSGQYSRYFFTHIPDDVAVELLRAVTDCALTRPQAVRALYAVKTLPAGATHHAGTGVRLQCTRRTFTVQTL